MIYAPEETEGDTIRAPVLKVFDGDGILTRLRHESWSADRDVPIRFGFIDAPEMDQPGGAEAHAFLTSLIAGRWLDLICLVKEDSGRTSDRWGRMFCVPYLRSSTGQFRNIELEMVLNGWAWVMDWWGPPDHYADALAEARHARRGIWYRDKNVAPWRFKQQQQKQRLAAKRQPDLFDS